MRLRVLDKKIFETQFANRQTGVFLFEPYGSVEVEYTGEFLHRLRPSSGSATQPLPEFEHFVVSGTEFQGKVWQVLLTISMGQKLCYSEVAKLIGHPKASRAVGTAIGRNPIGILIPCHRVIAKDGGLGGFAWGLPLKEKWLELEA